MTTQRIYEVAVDENFEIFMLIKVADVRQDRNGKDYIALTFQDKSGSIDGKYWSATPEEIERYQGGSVVLLGGKRELYKGTPQVRITSMRLATEEEPSTADQYVEEGPMSREEMIEEINSALGDITDPTINKIVRHILNQTANDFFVYPAAKKHHHAFVGGLGFHTISILKLAQHVAGQYPGINRSLLFSGALLHDVGKTVELSDPLTTEYTVEGNLIGHISIVADMISDACRALDIDKDDEKVILLKHMVLSHHGKQEWGSPVTPHLLEAEILHHLDNLDASIQMVKGALEHTEPGNFSERIFGLDGRNFFKSSVSFEGEAN